MAEPSKVIVFPQQREIESKWSSVSNPSPMSDMMDALNKSIEVQGLILAEIQGMNRRLDQLAGSGIDRSSAEHHSQITPPARFDKEEFMKLAGSVPKESFDPEHWQLD